MAYGAVSGRAAWSAWAPEHPAPTIPPPTTPRPAPTVAESGSYVVRPGDTLYRIARTFGVDLGLLAQVNHIQNPSRIYAGQTLVLPAPATPQRRPVATPTCSPTEAPLPPTAAPTATPAVTETPAPTEADSLVPAHMITLLLLGADGNGTSHWRTDSIMLLLFNRRTGRTGLLSIPRDLWVQIPAYGQGRINTVDFTGENTKYPGGGPALLREVLRENLGLTFEHYARIRFDGFVRVIDTIGGVDVTVAERIEDIFPHPTEPDALVYLDLEPGAAHLDGLTALAYARSRYATSDFDRARRQQDIITGLWHKLLRRETIRQIPTLYRELSSALVTDLTLTSMFQLLLAGIRLEPQNVHTLVIDLKMTKNWQTPKGSLVLVPDRGKLDAALANFFADLDLPADLPAPTAPPITPVPLRTPVPRAGCPICWRCPE